MAPGTNLVWTFAKNLDGQYEPMRQAKRYTRLDKSFENRAMAQMKCDELNGETIDRPTPLELIPDKTKN